MTMDTLQRLLERFPSNDAAGVEMHRRMRALAEAQALDPDKVPKERSLGAYVGQLRRGKLDWWQGGRRSQELARAALADMLGSTPESLGLTGPPDPTIRFPDFEALAPLETWVGPPPTLLQGRRGDGQSASWWQFPERPPGAHHWYVIPPGFGRSLLASWFDARGEATVLRCSSVEDALARLPSVGRVVVDLDGPPAEGEFGMLAGLELRGSLLILADREPAAGSSGESPTGADAATPPPLPPPWRAVRWTPREGWRGILTRWVASRLPEDSGLDPDSVLESFAEEEVAAVYARTPDLLMSVLAALHDDGLELPDQPGDLSLVRHWVAGAVRRHAEAGSQEADLLERHGVAFLGALVRERLRDLTLSFEGGLPRETWQALGARVGPAPDPEAVLHGASEIAAESDPVRRAAALERFETQVLGVASGGLVRGLVEAGVLRLTEPGRFDLWPSWLAPTLRERATVEILEQGPPAAWGRLLLDKERQTAAGSALASLAFLDVARFDSVIEACLDRAGSPDVGDRAALDAALSAVDTVLYLLNRDPSALIGSEIPVPGVQAAATVQRWFGPLLSEARRWLVQPVPSGPAVPPGWTIQGSNFAALQWVSACWLASAILPEGSWEHDGLEPWLVPGYQSSLSPAQISPGLRYSLRFASPGPSGVFAWGAALYGPLRNLLMSFDDLVDWSDWGEWGPGQVPDLFAPELLLASLAPGGDALVEQFDHWLPRLGKLGPEMTAVVLARIEACPDPVTLKRRALRLHPEARRGVASLASHLEHRGQLRHFEDAIDDDFVVALLEEFGPDSGPAQVDGLPGPFRGPVLRWLLDRPEEFKKDLDLLAGGLGRSRFGPFEDLGLFPELLRLIEVADSWIAAGAAWSLSADATWAGVAEAWGRPDAGGRKLAARLFGQAPESQYEAALDWLAEHPETLPDDERAAYFARRFASDGVEVSPALRERVWTMLVADRSRRSGTG